MITRITTLPQLEALQNSTMIYAVISALIALLIAFIISFIIKYQGGQDKSYITRRIWFIVIGIVSAAGFYLYNDLVVKGQIVNAGFKSMFVETNITCIGILLGIYFVLGILIMFKLRNSKFGSILGKGKE